MPHVQHDHFAHSTNQIIDLWRCRCRRPYLSSQFFRHIIWGKHSFAINPEITKKYVIQSNRILGVAYRRIFADVIVYIFPH